jgi:hypothetical protein
MTCISSSIADCLKKFLITLLFPNKNKLYCI